MKKLILVAGAAALGFAGPAIARPGHGHGNPHAYGIAGPVGYGAGGCPPGLAKKNPPCMPPGQAKKYAVGRPLPSDVVYYAVPRGVLVQLPPAPMGHEYVRVAADILLIAVGTGMVVDAMSDLMR